MKTREFREPYLSLLAETLHVGSVQSSSGSAARTTTRVCTRLGTGPRLLLRHPVAVGGASGRQDPHPRV